MRRYGGGVLAGVGGAAAQIDGSAGGYFSIRDVSAVRGSAGDRHGSEDSLSGRPVIGHGAILRVSRNRLFRGNRTAGGPSLVAPPIRAAASARSGRTGNAQRAAGGRNDPLARHRVQAPSSPTVQCKFAPTWPLIRFPSSFPSITKKNS